MKPPAPSSPSLLPVVRRCPICLRPHPKPKVDPLTHGPTRLPLLPAVQGRGVADAEHVGQVQVGAKCRKHQHQPRLGGS